MVSCRPARDAGGERRIGRQRGDGQRGKQHEQARGLRAMPQDVQAAVERRRHAQAGGDQRQPRPERRARGGHPPCDRNGADDGGERAPHAPLMAGPSGQGQQQRARGRHGQREGSRVQQHQARGRGEPGQVERGQGEPRGIGGGCGHQRADHRVVARGQ